MTAAYAVIQTVDKLSFIELVYSLFYFKAFYICYSLLKILQNALLPPAPF